MFICIVLSILLFILSFFEMKKVTQPKLRTLDVEVVENEFKISRQGDKTEFVYDTVFKYMDGCEEKYVRGDAYIEYQPGEKIRVYVNRKGKIAKKQRPNSKFPMIAYILLGFSFLISSLLFAVLNNHITFSSEPMVQIGVLIVGILSVASGWLLILDYKAQQNHLESDAYRNVVATVKRVSIHNDTEDDTKQVFITVCQCMRNGVMTNFTTPIAVAIPPRGGGYVDLKQDKETGEVFFPTVDVAPLYIGGIVVIVSLCISLYFLCLVFL